MVLAGSLLSSIVLNMPAKNLQSKDQSNSYSHLYNKGVEERNLFNDEHDYEVFLSYLKDYLTTPPDPKKTKKSFLVNGRTFQGVPHQPKNYFNKVELIAYSLLPDHFHLLVNQKTSGSLEKLIRSLCTRYVIYYNKKYQRSGSLFVGPYKSAQIENSSQLLYLTRYIHHESLYEKGYSSYEEYLGERANPWIRSDVVLSYFEKADNVNFKGKDGYRYFVEGYVLNQNEKEMSEKISFESNESKPEETRKNVLIPEASKKQAVHSKLTSEPKLKNLGFISTSVVVFLLLTALGIRNINTSEIPSPTSQVSGVETTVPEDTVSSPTPELTGTYTTEQLEQLINPSVSPIPEITEEENINSESKLMVIIKITDGAESVNIRENPSTESEILGKANDGGTFEYISNVPGWYQVKLNDETNAFISTRYAQIEGEE
ncbi:hypothetical protein A3A75_00105 [Candidatus Woesebacteria bacterium RIFCSPLOWO2_01_FULL_39_10]|uniref:SH3b domain-containing protein n=1 Tax=Candidatus Woesebacteria bacterium RIFCSPLOWO2_01_FULL_39_10 TaxID=1802516 RepID=A0A1F8B9V4_9BACT|nr:MAG: hypothetical protein A3A75_00105 [Candidatus Woesebacteria bacterium RIFCSPLOWO2_01_FULL_39_10]